MCFYTNALVIIASYTVKIYVIKFKGVLCIILLMIMSYSLRNIISTDHLQCNLKDLPLSSFLLVFYLISLINIEVPLYVLFLH